MLRIFAHAAAGTKISTRTAAAGHRDCSGRLSNRIHSYFIETGERVDPFVPEPGIEVRLATAAELIDMMKSGEFVSQLHLGALMLAEVRSFITFK